MAAAVGGRGMGGLYAGRGAGRGAMYNQIMAQSYGMPGYGAYPPGLCPTRVCVCLPFVCLCASCVFDARWNIRFN